MKNIYYAIMEKCTQLADRLMLFCTHILRDHYNFVPKEFQPISYRMARFAGDFAKLWTSIPRVDIYKIDDPDGCIIFIGNEQGLKHLCAHMIDDTIKPQSVGRVSFWRVAHTTKQWIAGDADLVIVESSRIKPPLPETNLRFSVPKIVQQAITLSSSVDDLLAGAKRKSRRQHVNKALQLNLQMRFSTSQTDLERWYHKMYVPYISARHGKQAAIGPLSDFTRWLNGGGLLMIEHDNVAIGGLLVYLKSGICYSLEGGFLPDLPEDLEKHIVSVADYFNIQWAIEQGATTYSMGMSTGWRSNAIFQYKRSWGARVTRPHLIYPVLTFMADEISPALRDKINEIRFVCEHQDEFKAVWIAQGNESSELIAGQREAAIKDGLTDLHIVPSHNQNQLFKNNQHQILAETSKHA